MELLFYYENLMIHIPVEEKKKVTESRKGSDITCFILYTTMVLHMIALCIKCLLSK